MHEPDSLQEASFLLFSLAESRLGIEASQVGAIEAVADLTAFRMPFFRIDQILFPAAPLLTCQAPVALIPASPERQHAVIIDSLEDIRPISVRHIRPFPRLMQLAEGKNFSYWGVALLHDSIILLVDLFQLIDTENKKQHTMRGRSRRPATVHSRHQASMP